MAIHWSLKMSAFVASVVSLSWFFAGWRQVNEKGGLGDWGLLFFGTGLTLSLLVLQGYWIYSEEKEKGSLRKRIGFYEFIHARLQAARVAPKSGETDSSSSITGDSK